MASNEGNGESTNLTEDQIAQLEENFVKVSRHPEGMTLMLIAAECGLSEDDTAVSIAYIERKGVWCYYIKNEMSKAECYGLPVVHK